AVDLARGRAVADRTAVVDIHDVGGGAGQVDHVAVGSRPAIQVNGVSWTERRTRVQAGRPRGRVEFVRKVERRHQVDREQVARATAKDLDVADHELGVELQIVFVGVP